MKCPSCTFSFSDLRDICPRCLLDVRPYKQETGIAIADANASYECLVRKLGRQPRPRLLKEPGNASPSAQASPNITPQLRPEPEEVTVQKATISPASAAEPDSTAGESLVAESSPKREIETENSRERAPTAVMTAMPKEASLPHMGTEPIKSSEPGEENEDNLAFFASLEKLGEEISMGQQSPPEELPPSHSKSSFGVTAHSTDSDAADNDEDDLTLVIAEDEDLHPVGSMIDASNPDEWDLSFDSTSSPSSSDDSYDSRTGVVAGEDDPFSIFSTLESLEEKSCDEDELCLDDPELPPDVVALLQASWDEAHEKSSPQAGHTVADDNELFTEVSTFQAESQELELNNILAPEESLEGVNTQVVIHAESDNATSGEESSFLSLDADDEAEIENLLLQLESNIPMLVTSNTPPSPHEIVGSPVQSDNYEGKAHVPRSIDHDSAADEITAHITPTTPSNLLGPEELAVTSSSGPESSDPTSESDTASTEFGAVESIATLFDAAFAELTPEQHDFELSLFQLSAHEHSELIELYFELTSEALINPESELKYVDLAAVASSERRIEAEQLKGEVKAAEQRIDAQEHRLRIAAESEATLAWSSTETQSAPLMLRLLALTIDLLLALVASAGVSVWLLVKEHPWLLDVSGLITMPPDSILVSGLCYTVALLPPVLVLTQLLTLSFLQGSIGMRLCGIRLIRIDGGPIAFLHALVRAVLGPISLLSGSCLKVLFKRPSLADRLSRTRAVVFLEPANDGDSRNSIQTTPNEPGPPVTTAITTKKSAIENHNVPPPPDDPTPTENPSDEHHLSV